MCVSSYSSFITITGLAFDIIGAVFLFKYGLPSYAPPINKGASQSLDYRQTEEIVESMGDTNPAYRIYKIKNHLGIIFLIFGFVLQIIAEFIDIYQ